MNIPKRYEDLTVSQFQELEALKNDDTLDKLDKSIKRLSILSGKSVEYIEKLKPSLVYEKLLDAIFLIEPINSMASPESFTLAYKKFRYIKSIDQYTTAQQKDFTEILKVNNNDYIACLPELMAICHQELTLFGWKYKPENHFKNLELFKQSKLKDSLGAVFFYSNCLKSYSEIIEDCLLKANEMIQAHVKTMMDDQEFQTFLKGGAGNTRSA
jgi:hypothetical protein